MSAPAKKELPLGIHFGLDEDLHHTDPALGSSDIRRLRRSPPDYWNQSWMNQSRKKQKDTVGRLRGHAMHKLLYEGEAAFDKRFMCGARHSDDMTPPEKGAATKAANAKAASMGKAAVPADDYDQIVMAAAMITKNPDLASVFSGGFSEVTIIWQRDGVRLKARLDYLKARGVGDLKGCANQHESDFGQACREAIARYRYDMQAAHYLEARALLPKMVADGAVYGDHDAALLKKIAASREFGWQWIFYQTEGAPITWSRTLSPDRVDPKTGEIITGNPMLQVARDHCDEGIRKYKENLERFGHDMWLLLERPSELFMAEMPGWHARS